MGAREARRPKERWSLRTRSFGPAAAGLALIALAAITPDSLDLREGCAVVLRRTEQGPFEGGTVGTGCASSLRGAAPAPSEAELTSGGLTSRDRGFDADGNRVWGAAGGSYVFDRIVGGGAPDARDTEAPGGAAPRDP